MSIIQEIETKLSNYPEISYESTATSLTVSQRRGANFSVSIGRRR